MAFSDPVTVTINSVAKTLPRINQDKYGSEYFIREATQEFTLRLRNSTYGANGSTIDRHNAELVQTVYATPTTPAITRKSYITFDVGRADTDAGVLQTLNGFVAFLSSANLQKLLNRES
jgi:hypothetical protein